MAQIAAEKIKQVEKKKSICKPNKHKKEKNSNKNML